MGALKSLAFGLGSLPGAPLALQRLFEPHGAAVLMYHAVVRSPLAVTDWCFVSEHEFRAQMCYLAEHCRVVSLSDLPAALARGGSKPIVALTFDDGYQNNFEVAFPILRELDLPASIFLATDFVDSDDTLWFCRINQALADTALQRLTWQGRPYDLSTAAARATAHGQLQVELKALPHEQLLAHTRQLLEALGTRPGAPVPRDSPYRFLSSAEIRAMVGSGLVEFGAHTRSHAILSGLPPEERSAQISDSLRAVERLTGAACTLFAYPNGRASDYGACDVMQLSQDHVALAVTTVAGPNRIPLAPLELRRYGVGAQTPMPHFKLLTHHVLWKLRN